MSVHLPPFDCSVTTISNWATVLPINYLKMNVPLPQIPVCIRLNRLGFLTTPRRARRLHAIV